ncbi:hypothetical protein [Dyella lutea]|uniref:Uncharacterized protein n=1 Tax=Dyella lutea TaxID=2950441 RepID=A0ABT1F609_9GAMM|nr:hypothetical protein [Dyella lutea]MCP1372826.1 hypothetical protein [Dyella lutea]
MSTRFDRVIRAYGPLRLRGTLTEGHWMQAPRKATTKDPARPKRAHLFALVALLLRQGRSRP